ncbi:AbrB/MazE/SpoVT family DNA-binding domain-containing protein [Paradesulfitobacterium aromaticivorans]
MKATGIIRRIDDLGRIVIAKELRRTLGIEEGDPLEAFTQDDQIILKKYQPGCVLCGNVEHLVEIRGKQVCRECIDSLAARRDR